MAVRVKCPHCEAEVIWEPQNKWRPFCSERCKLLDLGAWANEEYRIAGQTSDPGLGDDDSRTS